MRTAIAQALVACALLFAARAAHATDDDAAEASARAVSLEDLASRSDDQPDADAPEADAAPIALPDLSILAADPVHGVESSGFGWRDDPIRHRARFHRGDDYRAPRGTVVHAAARGFVVFCGRRGGYGRMIEIDHGDGVRTRYGHLDQIEVVDHQLVDADMPIGRVGSSGRATGPHLHFEVRLDGRAVDPTLAIRIGQMQKSEPPDVVQAAAQGLRPDVTESAVSDIDPPHGPPRAPRSHKHHAAKKPRPPRVS